MNLKKASKVLQKAFSHYNNLGFEITFEKNHLEAKANLTVKAHDDDIYTKFQVYESGRVYYEFFFDYLNKTDHALNLINDFNDNVLFLKASIRDNGCLLLSCNTPYISEPDLEEFTVRVMSELVDDDTEKYLKPLTALTAPKD